MVVTGVFLPFVILSRALGLGLAMLLLTLSKLGIHLIGWYIKCPLLSLGCQQEDHGPRTSPLASTLPWNAFGDSLLLNEGDLARTIIE
jgi:hypothetical protein